MKGRPLSEIPERFHKEIMQQLNRANQKDALKAPTRAIPFVLTQGITLALPTGSPFASAVREHRFHPTRKFRFDYAWPDQKVAMEVDGGLFVKGGHSRGAAREYDMARDAEAMMLGWKVLRVSTKHFKNGEAARWVGAILQLP